MDLSGALLDEVILEVHDEEWVQTVDYEHIHSDVVNATSMGTYLEISLSAKQKTSAAKQTP